jgi:hypothetical protein
MVHGGDNKLAPARCGRSHGVSAGGNSHNDGHDHNDHHAVGFACVCSCRRQSGAVVEVPDDDTPPPG